MLPRYKLGILLFYSFFFSPISLVSSIPYASSSSKTSRPRMIWFIFLLVILVTGTPDIDAPQDNPPETHLPITDLTFIRTWAAIGDSYTAGIGAGDLWSDRKEDYKCSRYDKSYVALLKHLLGPQVEKFSYKACSGARTGDIYNQARELDKFHDLIVMTGGGNDLCLVC